MSEPSSFFLRATIKKDQYLKFMQDRPRQPVLNDGWLKWWESRKMYGKSDLEENIRTGCHQNNQEIVNGWLTAEGTLAFSEFHEVTNIWEFGIIMCSENYSEIIPLLVFCESIFSYKNFSSHDFAIIYPYFWGDSSVMAYMTFPQDGAALTLAGSVADVAKDHLDYAALRLGENWKVFEAKMNYD